MKKIILSTLLLTGCASTPRLTPALQTQIVYKPVLKSCIPQDLAPAPEYPDSNQSLLDAQSAAQRYRLLFAGRLLRIERLAELENVVKDCE